MSPLYAESRSLSLSAAGVMPPCAPTSSIAVNRNIAIASTCHWRCRNHTAVVGLKKSSAGRVGSEVLRTVNGHTFLACACAELVAHAPSSRRMTGTTGPDPRPDWLSRPSAPHCCRMGRSLPADRHVADTYHPLPELAMVDWKARIRRLLPTPRRVVLSSGRNHPSGHAGTPFP